MLRTPFLTRAAWPAVVITVWWLGTLTSYVFSWPLIYTSVASPELVGFVLLATTSLGAGVVASQLVFTKISHERRLGNPQPPADQLSIWLKGLTLVSFGLGIWAVIVYGPNLGFDNLPQNLDRGTAYENANVATMMPRSERLAFLIVSAFFSDSTFSPGPPLEALRPNRQRPSLGCAFYFAPNIPHCLYS